MSYNLNYYTSIEIKNQIDMPVRVNFDFTPAVAEQEAGVEICSVSYDDGGHSEIDFEDYEEILKEECFEYAM